MPTRPPLIHYLENVRRWIWLSYFAGFIAFVGIIALLDATSAPGTPANELVTGSNGWLFLIPIALVSYGFYVSARYWRCPHCSMSLPTKSYQPVPARCGRCGTPLRALD